MDEVCVRFRSGLWLWTAISRQTRLFLGFVLGDRTDDSLTRLLDEEVHWAWRDVPICTDGWPAYQRLLGSEQLTVCDKGSGKTSIVEALNTKIRQCQSGLARRSCGVCWRIIDDLTERFLLFVERHNRECLRRWHNRYQSSQALAMPKSP